MGAETSPGRSCFGFEVHSGLSLALGRAGPGTSLLIDEALQSEPPEIGALVREWAGKPGARLTNRLYSLGNVDQFWVDRVGWFTIDPGIPSITVPALSERFDDPAWRESIMWGTPAAACAVRRGLMSMHAASVDVGGSSLLLTAPGTYGKTTLAGAFHTAGYRLLSDDMATYQLSPHPAVFPGPALLRVRLDVRQELEFDGIAESHKFGRKVGLVINENRRGDATPVPLAGVIMLRRAQSGIKLTRVAPEEALRDLFLLSFGAVLDPGAAFEGLAALVARVPIWNLERRLEYATLPAVVETIVDECLGRHATR